MLSIEKVDTNNKAQVKRFVQFYYDLYKGCRQFVPPLFADAYLPLNRKKHIDRSTGTVSDRVAVRAW